MPTPSHVPVLLDRVVALLAPALDRTTGAVLVDARSASAGTARRCWSGSRRPG